MKRKAIGYRTAYSKEIEKAVTRHNKMFRPKLSQNDFVERCVEKELVLMGILK